MDYSQARELIDSLTMKKGIVPGLDSIRKILDTLGNPQEKVPVIHVAGTNGKGSFTAFMASILMKAGYRTGVYNSPSVFEYNERIRIGTENISDDDYAREISLIMEQKGDIAATAFEVETAAAFDYFERKKCDIAVIETGMGGKDDATNVCNHPLISVIMSIGMDHMAFLGNTIEEIAACKAGIIKEQSDVVVCHQKKDVLDIVSGVAKTNKADLIITGSVKAEYNDEQTIFSYKSYSGKKYYSLKIKLLGSYQPDNAAVAIEASEILSNKGFHISENDIRMGLENAVWHGRFEKICDSPVIYIDGAHNPPAACRLKESIELYLKDKYKIIYVIGVLADKDFDKIMDYTLGYASYIYTLTPDNSRAMSGEKLKQKISERTNNVKNAETVDNAIELAIKKTSEYENAVILAFGSLSYLGEFKRKVIKQHDNWK